MHIFPLHNLLFISFSYLCRLYEQRSQRNHQYPIRQLRFHGAGDCHLQALWPRSVAVADLCSSAGDICIRHAELFPDGSHSAIHCAHAALLRSWRQLYHQPQSPFPMYQHTIGVVVHLSLSPLGDEQSCRR